MGVPRGAQRGLRVHARPGRRPDRRRVRLLHQVPDEAAGRQVSPVGNLVKTVTLEVTGQIRDAAAKVGLITKDWQALAGKSPLELKAELTGSEKVKARLAEIDARAERLKKEFPD